MSLEKNIPNLFIIGAPKCGTTSIIHYLGQHPDIFVSPVKEPHYFNFDSGHRYFFEMDEYLKLFRTKKTYDYYAEGSVWYLYSRVAVDEILKFNPNAKFLVLLRDPISMFFSLHQELLFGGSENVKSSIKAWNLQSKRIIGENIPRGCSDERFLQYGEACKLGRQVSNVIDKIHKQNLKFVLLDDLKDNPDSTYNDILNFLNLPSMSLDSYEVVNIKKVRKSYALTKFFIFITNLKKRVGIKKGFGISSTINKYNVTSDISINKGEYKKLKPILEDYFKNDIILLEGLINRDLSIWYKN